MNCDKLEKIFEMQKKFDDSLIESRKLEGISADKWLQMQTLAMLSELSELLDEVNFKWWKNPVEINHDRIKEELVDILHFFTGMCLKAGMSADELFKRYMNKNEENFKRQKGTSLKQGYKV